jgi:tRNA pseudouridine55 synthase
MYRYSGILPVHKKTGMTSHDVVHRVRTVTGEAKVGHTGTLDPMASGLLLLCLGPATKLTQFLSGWDKRYSAEVTLGKVSDTLDADGEISDGGTVPELSEADIAEVLDKFTGLISQRVPAYSAVKQRGRRLYKMARRGKSFEAPERTVTIKSLELRSYVPPRLTVEVSCSKGTYIRTLADDIGRELGCGGYLSSLKRLAVGRFELESALTIDEIRRRHNEGDLESAIVPMEEVIDFPCVKLRAAARETIRRGGIPGESDILDWRGEFSPGDLISVVDEGGRIMAIGKSRCDTASARAQKGREFFSYVRVLI